MNSFFSEDDFPILNNELQIDEMTFNFGISIIVIMKMIIPSKK